MKPNAIIWNEVLDSTNNELKRNGERYDNLSIVAARYQTAGRGQGNHSWKSAAGENLTFSILLRFGNELLRPLKANAIVLITQVATLSLRELLLSEGLPAQIKWPNDIWVDGRKICGMLIENTLDREYVASSVIGIGLNLNQQEFDPLLPNPVSLWQLTGKKYDPEATLDRYAQVFCRYADMLNTDEGRLKLNEEFGKYVFVLDEERQKSLTKAIEDFEASL